MPATSSIYWDSVDSQRSSGGSSGDATNNRHYVDPWDLENYAYIRRCSIIQQTYQPQSIYQRGNNSRLSHRSKSEQSEYWYSPPIREPGYDAPASVEEIYGFTGHHQPTNYHYQPIYEEEEDYPNYTSSQAQLYSRLSDFQYRQMIDERESREIYKKRRSSTTVPHYQDLTDESIYGKLPRPKSRSRSRSREPSQPTYSQNYVEKLYEQRYTEKPARQQRNVEKLYDQRRVEKSRQQRNLEKLYEQRTVEKLYDQRRREKLYEQRELENLYEQKRLDKTYEQRSLNTYGHLKIDYTNSWNSLHRKIVH